MSRRPPPALARKLDAVFSALSDRTRRRIRSRLAEAPATISELPEPRAMTLLAVSKHLRVLGRAGLLQRERDGWYHRCSLDARPLEPAVAFVSQYRPFWEATLEQLAKHVEQPAGAK